MEDKFRLRSEVVNFFNKDKSTQIRSLSSWVKEGICEEILERVERIRIVYGHEKDLERGINYSSLSGWKSEGKKATFNFTIEAHGISNKDYQHLNRRKLMDNIQRTINDYMSENIETNAG